MVCVPGIPAFTSIGLKDVADFVGLECSTITIIANRTGKAEETPRMKILSALLPRARSLGLNSSYSAII